MDKTRIVGDNLNDAISVAWISQVTYVQVPVQEQVHRIMGNRESAKAGTEKSADSPCLCWEDICIILLFVMLESGRLWGGCGGLRAYLMPTCVGLRKRKNIYVCRHRGNRAYIHTHTHIHYIFFNSSQDSGFQARIRTTWSPSRLAQAPGQVPVSFVWPK